jgi:hypothetical protein
VGAREDSYVHKWLREHGLGVALVVIFAILTSLTLLTGWPEFQAEQLDHGQPVVVSDFWRWWVFEYSMSLVADVFGAILLVLLTKSLWEKGSAESKDDDPDQN